MQRTTPHRRAVILGAGGFIGINLAHSLAKDGCELICFDRFQCHYWPTNVKAIVGDFSQLPEELLAVLDDAAVYHLVSSCRPHQHTETAADEIVADVSSTLRYLEYTRCKNIRWVFVSSGGTVYGPNASCPTTEDAQTNPICSYGLIKLALEKYFALYKTLHETDFVVARVSNPYGPWQDPSSGQGVIAALVYKALAVQAVEIWGDGENVRDYVYIDDAVRGLMDLAKHGESGEIYNVSSGVGTTINDLIQVIRHTLGIQLNTNCVAARIFDVRKSVLSSNKLQSLTGWGPNTCLGDGIKATADWLSKKLRRYE